MMSAEMAWRALALGGGWFAILFVAQIFIWRLMHPRRQIILLFALYFSPAAFLLFSAPPAGVVLFAFSCAYVMTFPAIQAESPTLRLIRLMRESGGEMAENEVIRILGQESILSDRKRDLTNDGLTSEKGELGLAGRRLAQFFRSYRRWAGLKEGSG